MTEQKKPTPAQQIKDLRKEIKQREDMIFKLTDEVAAWQKKADEEYSRGYTDGQKYLIDTQSAITRWAFKKK